MTVARPGAKQVVVWGSLRGGDGGAPRWRPLARAPKLCPHDTGLAAAGMSPFLERALGGTKGTVRLIDEDPELFESLPAMALREAAARAVAPVLLLRSGAWHGRIRVTPIHHITWGCWCSTA